MFEKYIPMIETFLPLIVMVLPIIICIVCFNFIFNFFVNLKLKKVFNENAKKIKKDMGQPLKVISATLIGTGHESIYNHDSIVVPAKINIYNNIIVVECTGKCVVITDYKDFSIRKNTFYEEVFYKKIERVREDLMLYKHPFNLQFQIQKKYIEYMKNLIEESNNE